MATDMSFLLLLETRFPAEEVASWMELGGDSRAPTRDLMGEGEDRWDLAGNSNFVLKEEGRDEEEEEEEEKEQVRGERVADDDGEAIIAGAGGGSCREVG